MLFKDFFSEFVSGVPVKREPWDGHWVYKHGRIEMHTKGGDVIDLLDTEDVLFTVSNLLQDDWVLLRRGNNVIHEECENVDYEEAIDARELSR